MASGRPLTVAELTALFGTEEACRPASEEVQAALEDLAADCQDRGFELKQVASGYRFQVRQELAQWIGRLWQEKPQKYSRALLETLAIIAYRQPVTRGEIEEIRGVSVSSNIVKTLLEREWIRVIGHRDVPGRPAMLATTKKFLDYFNLRQLDDLPSLSEIRDLVEIAPELGLEEELKARTRDGDETLDQGKPLDGLLGESPELSGSKGEYAGEFAEGSHLAEGSHSAEGSHPVKDSDWAEELAEEGVPEEDSRAEDPDEVTDS